MKNKLFIRRQTKAGLLALSVICAVLYISCAHTISRSQVQETSSVSAKQVSDTLDALMKNIAAQFGQKELNLTIGIIKDGKVFLTKHYGYSNPVTNTRFSDQTLLYMASTSKSFTGTMGAILHKKGVIKLDKTLADYLHGFRFNNEEEMKSDQITVRSLHTHTHAINNTELQIYTAFVGHNGTGHMIDLLKKYSRRRPNAEFSYSNTGPVVYSLLVEKQTGKPWQQVMDEEVFRPLGMRSATSYVSKVDNNLIVHMVRKGTDGVNAYFHKADNSMSAAGGHVANMPDLLRYLNFFMTRGQSVLGLLTREEIEYAISPIVPQKNKYHSFERYGYGLGWEQSILNGEECVSRFGTYGGIFSHMSFLRDKNIGIVAIGNTVGLESLVHLASVYVYNTMLSKENKMQFLADNLTALRRNQQNDSNARGQLTKAKNSPYPNPGYVAGNYSDGEATMRIGTDASVVWGNLKGKLYTLTDTSGVIDFGSMTRQAKYKKEDGKFTGLYADERYFRKE